MAQVSSNGRGELGRLFVVSSENRIESRQVELDHIEGEYRVVRARVTPDGWGTTEFGGLPIGKTVEPMQTELMPN